MHEVQKLPALIMMAEDDVDYYRLVKEAFKRMGTDHDVRNVGDGEELLDYLMRRGKYDDPLNSPTPGLIFLDINMPKKNGFKALEEIRANSGIRQIPVVMLSISDDKKDILRSYSLGANSFVTKPFEFQKLVDALGTFQKYWFQTVTLPV